MFLSISHIFLYFQLLIIFNIMDNNSKSVSTELWLQYLYQDEGDPD